MAPPQYGDNPQQQALINLLLQDNNELEQRQDLVYDRRDMGNDDAAPLPTIDWQSRPSKALTLANAAASDASRAQELEMVMQFANAPPKAAHHSDTWNRRIIDFYLVYSQFMALYTSIPATAHFTVETLVKYAMPYLVIRAIKTKGMDGARIKSRTLITWMDGLINGVWQYAHKSTTDRTSAAKEVLFKHALARRIRSKVDQLIRVLGLSKILRMKHILDMPDLLLIIDSALYDTRFSSDKRLAVIQFIMSWCIILYTGLRPMSLAASNKRYLEHGHYMRVRNIKIHTNTASDWTVSVNATQLKGHVTGLEHKDMTFVLRSVKKTHNIMFCPATWVVLYLWLRGAFPQYKTLRDLWTTTDIELVIKPSMLDEPFLLAGKEGGKGLQQGKAASAIQISASLNYHAHNNFMFGMTAYALRRGLANLLAHQLDDARAAVVLGHKDADSVFNKHYSRGTADIDLVGLVTREADVQPDKPGMYLDSTRRISPSLHALLAQRWWAEQDDTHEEASAQELASKAYGKNGENVKLTPEQDEACKPDELAKLSDAALEQFWVCFEPNSVKERNTMNVNRLHNGIATGVYRLKQGVDPEDVDKYRTQAISALKELHKSWTVRRRQEKKNIAKKWLEELKLRPTASVQDLDLAVDDLRRRNEEAIERLVAEIPNDAPEQDLMTRTQMDTTLQHAFRQETDDLGDVVDKYGRTNPLPRATLNKRFVTNSEIAEMEATFGTPFITLDEQEVQVESEQALVIDGEHGDNGLEDDADADDVLCDDIIAVRRELMELVATPILCVRDGRPIPGQGSIPSCCNRDFKEMYLYKEHMRWVHSEWNEFLKESKVGSKWNCPPCNESWKLRSDFINHALEDCTEKERNQGWYALVKEKLEANAENAKMRRQRQEIGPNAMRAQETVDVTVAALKDAGIRVDVLDFFRDTTAELKHASSGAPPTTTTPPDDDSDNTVMDRTSEQHIEQIICMTGIGSPFPNFYIKSFIWFLGIIRKIAFFVACETVESRALQ